MSDNTGAPSPIPYGFARCCKCQRVRPVHRLECDLLEPDAAWCYSGCDGPAQLTECYYSPTGLALMDEQGRCTCERPPPPIGGTP